MNTMKIRAAIVTHARPMTHRGAHRAGESFAKQHPKHIHFGPSFRAYVARARARSLAREEAKEQLGRARNTQNNETMLHPLVGG